MMMLECTLKYLARIMVQHRYPILGVVAGFNKYFQQNTAAFILVQRKQKDSFCGDVRALVSISQVSEEF